MDETAVGLENFGAAQGDAAEQFPQVQGGGDGHADGMKGAQLGNPLLCLEGNLAASQGSAELSADGQEGLFFFLGKPAGFVSKQGKDAIRGDVVEDGEKAQESKCGKGRGKGRGKQGQLRAVRDQNRGFLRDAIGQRTFFRRGTHIRGESGWLAADRLQEKAALVEVPKKEGAKG